MSKVSFKQFKDEIDWNRPQMALYELIPILEAMQNEIDELKGVQPHPEVAEAEDDVEVAEVKKAPAKKAAAKAE